MIDFEALTTNISSDDRHPDIPGEAMPKQISND